LTTTPPLSDVPSAIYDCEENSSLRLTSDWDGGRRATIGRSQHGGANAEAYVDSPLRQPRGYTNRRCGDIR